MKVDHEFDPTPAATQTHQANAKASAAQTELKTVRGSAKAEADWSQG